MKGVQNLLAVICVFVGDWQNLYLYRCKPGWECTCKVLDQDTDETLNRTVNNTVDHNRTMFLSVCSCVFQFESLRQLEVKLDSTALPRSSDGVFQMEVDLRSVERSISFIYYIWKSQIVQCATKCFSSHIPIFITSHAVLRSCRKLHMVFKSKQAVNFIDQFYNAFDLITYLLWCHEDMCIILCKASYTHQSMKLS